MTTYGLKKVFISALDEVSQVNEEGLGTIRLEGNKFYKYVKYKEGTGALDVVAGDVVYYSDYSASEVTPDLSDTDNVGAGVIVAAAITETDRFCWIQIKGEADLNTDVVAGANGNALTAVGANDKTLDVSALVSDAICAYLLDDTASAQKILCDFPF